MRTMIQVTNRGTLFNLKMMKRRQIIMGSARQTQASRNGYYKQRAKEETQLGELFYVFTPSNANGETQRD